MTIESLRRKPKLRIVQTERAPTLVCGIEFRANEEHALRSIMAWRKREHPAWSQYAVSYRVTNRRRLKTVTA